MDSPTNLEILSEQECLFLLDSRDLGRVALLVQGQIEIFPVNYAMDGAIVAFRTAPGTKLSWAPKTAVSFEVDDWDPVAEAGWSVVVKGLVREVTDEMGPYAESIRSLPVRTRAPGPHSHWLAIYASSITGRRFRLHSLPAPLRGGKRSTRAGVLGGITTSPAATSTGKH